MPQTTFLMQANSLAGTMLEESVFESNPTHEETGSKFDRDVPSKQFAVCLAGECVGSSIYCYRTRTGESSVWFVGM